MTQITRARGARRVHRAARLALVTTVVAGALAGTTPASAATPAKVVRVGAPVLQYGPDEVTAGQRVLMQVKAHRGYRCTLVAARGRQRSSTKAVTATRPYVLWRWTIGRAAASGTWTVRATCTPPAKRGVKAVAKPMLTSVTVAPSRQSAKGSRSMFMPGTIRATTSKSPLSGHAGAQGGRATAGGGGGANPFSYGQCTYHAYEMRPDIFDTAVQKGVPRGGYAPGGGYWWDAWRWADNARNAGFAVGTTPAAGAVVSWPKGYGGSAVGHVAYVLQVNSDGSFLVSERNWNYNANVTRRLAHPYPGAQFIYASGAAPAPTPTSPPTPSNPNPSTDRQGVTSYDRMAPGAPHLGYFDSAWQPFLAQSNTITYLAATVGNPSVGSSSAGTLTLRLCTDPNCGQILAEAHPSIANYGETGADIGDVAVNRGSTYYVVWYQPSRVNGATFVTDWWAGGASITTSDQMQAVVRGYNR